MKKVEIVACLVGIAFIAGCLIATHEAMQKASNQPVMNVNGIVVEKRYQPETSYMTRQGRVSSEEEFLIEVNFGEEYNVTYRNVSKNDSCNISYQKVSWGIRIVNSSIPTYVR